ncbi:MAG: hypothetical protein D6687_02015 [Acidobacteria bacterium]|jgi:hypothetical protein|nr:MAG: hypothetical protein D6687_02015 [Acidobacteriota bacterium]GIU81855.1 MAG: hypothetical protein KatS3mg006_0919 [Pyrinomonadaceae bacterium]
MPDFLRKLLRKLNESLTKKLSSKRFQARFPIKVTIYPEIVTGKLKSARRPSLSISGETVDLSKTGVGFVVSAIRLKEHYLVGENRTLYSEIDLPNGKVRMELLGVRYEQIEIHDSESKYLIGARIISIDPMSKEIYEEFLRLRGRIKPKKQNFSLEAKS